MNKKVEIAANSTLVKPSENNSIFAVRTYEPEYAKLNDPDSKKKNRYNNRIKLTEIDDNGVSLNINGNDAIGSNPNRTKQHGFHFTADNCIGCHACESACSEKNDLPPHLSFRSVGYIEGGSYPAYQRMNISMACNHCDDPVCLKGCPTRAYTKHPEYGAVIQDPDICFGCGYCTWVCPYNAPQLDPVAGQVEKCNMCVDRLEEGLKPACVSACLGNALDFGVIENTPENREQIKTEMPGFPDPAISQPNIRFQQTNSLPSEFSRPDSSAVKYVKTGEHYKPAVTKESYQRHWNLAKLSSKENPLVLFTLSVQAAAGAFAIIFALTLMPGSLLIEQSWIEPLIQATSLGAVAFGLFMSTVHLGKPVRFYRGFNNLRHSPVSREGLGIVLFMAFMAACFACSIILNPTVMQLSQTLLGFDYFGLLASVTLLSWLTPEFIGNFKFGFAILAIVSAIGSLFFMYQCYRIKARPFWDHWQTATSFAGTTLHLGAVMIAAVVAFYALISGESFLQMMSVLIPVLATITLTGLLVESSGLLAHAYDMNKSENEGAVSHYVQITTFGKTYLLRNTLLALGFLLLTAILTLGLTPLVSLLLFATALIMIMISSIIGRCLFYVLVIPTTMPGAFFWKNKGFEEHARDIGLAANPAVGVAECGH